MNEVVDTQSIENDLRQLNSFSKSIEASAVMTRDGYPVVTLLSDSVNAERMSAMSASMLSLADKAAKDLDRGNLKQVIIHSEKGFIILVQVDESAVLSVISRADTKLGMLLVETKKAALQIASRL